MVDVQGVVRLKMKQELSERSARHRMRVTENTMHRTAMCHLFWELLG